MKVNTSKQRPYIIAHRGFHKNCVENTMSAFQAAKTIGAHGIELDVHVTKDGQIVVFHDPWIRRATKGERRLRLKRLSYAELRHWSESQLGEAMPLLSDVLDRFLPSFHWINIELKGQGARGDNLLLIEKVVHLLRSYPPGKILISSFHPFILRQVKDLAPDQKTGFLMQPRTVTSPIWQFCLNYTRADFFHPRYDWYFKWQHLHTGTNVSLWTLDDRTLFEHGVNTPSSVFSIITNRPDLWVR